MKKGIEIFRQLVLPVATAFLLALLFRPAYMKDGTCDYLLAWILIGFPFGIRRMFLVLLPSNFDLAGTVGICFLNVMVGGIIGGFALMLQVLKGLVVTVKILLRR
jgi:hypothetical protein